MVCDAEGCGFQMLNDDEIKTSVQEKSDSVDSLYEGESNSNDESNKGSSNADAFSVLETAMECENAISNAFWDSVRSNISKRWNTTENDVSKNQSLADSALRLPNSSILNSNAADITEYFLDVPNYIILNIL
ncbi:hypothetical protein TNCV_3817401 [Trichonephila clavipes]|nr:hypothetical protein TNCV_3817401 [Trichonephila clavipes]